MFMRVANAIRVINDERGNLPDITRHGTAKTFVSGGSGDGN